jgi:hypothetical protein
MGFNPFLLKTPNPTALAEYQIVRDFVVNPDDVAANQFLNPEGI